MSRFRPLLALVLCIGATTLRAQTQGTAATRNSTIGPAQAGVGLRPALDSGPHDLVVDGVRLWYRVAGNGTTDSPPVVFLHGGPGYNSHSFAVLVGPRLERALRMVYFDQRGSGHSERPWTRDYAMPTLVQDVDAVRQALGVPRIAVIGHSFGGTLALEYAARYPEHVSRLILVSAASDLPATCRARREWLAANRADALARALADTGRPRGDCDLALGTLRGTEAEVYNNAVMFPDSTIRRTQDSVDATSGLRNTGELQRALFSAGLLQHRFASPVRLTMPVLILAGRHDSAIGLDQQRALARSLPNARIEEYERGGHFLYLDEPDRFARETIAFLTRSLP